MAGRAGFRRLLAGALLAGLVLALTAPGAYGQAAGPPDQVDPPAPGEGRPLDDPSDPPSQGRAAATRSRIGLTGMNFPPQAVEVIAGASRSDTAVLASRAGWPNGAPAAVLTTGDDFPDALAASGLAGTVGGPLLLTTTGALEPGVAEELRRLRPATVYAVGALADPVVAALEQEGHTVERVRGDNRYETSYAVASKARSLGADTSTLLVASGEGFADALSASALAAGLKHPLLLVPRDGLRDWLAGRSAELGATNHWVVGGSAVVSDEAVAGLPVDRLAGGDRYETSSLVAARGLHFGLQGRPVLASGEAFPDGLSGGVLAGGARRAPLLVSGRRDLPIFAAAFLGGRGLGEVTKVGGADALGLMVDCQLRAGSTRPWLCAEEELARQGYNTGAIDGRVDAQTVWVTYAFDKVIGFRPDAAFGELEWQRMLDVPRLVPRRPDLPPNHIELDIGRQLVLVVRDGQVRHALHTSTGKASTPTVRGTFTVYEKRNYRQANHLYRAVFWYRGYAFHGYPEIPLYPASHGCSRMYDGDMDFLWPMLSIGERVATY